MTELFYHVVRASLSGSIVIAVVLIARLALTKAPKSVFCLLWLLAGLRLALPFEIESSLSLQPDMQQIVRQQEEVSQNTPLSDLQTQKLPTETQVPAVPGDLQLPEDLVIEYGDNAVTDHRQAVIDYAAIAAWVWAAGTAALGIYSIASYRRLKKQVAEAVRMEDGYWESGKIDAAFVLGFFRPRIYLPVGLTEQDRELILEHERTHISRGDHISKLAGYWVLAVHWFNPLVWVGYACLCRDIEMACDERVVRGRSLESRKAYAEALLNCGGHTARIAACPVAFGESDPKARIRNVLSYRKPGFWILAVAVAVLVFVAVCLMTSPAGLRLADYAAVMPGSVTAGDLSGGNWSISLNASRIGELEKVLRSTRVSGEGTGEQGVVGDYQLLIEHDDTLAALQLSGDCSEVWTMGGVKREILNPSALRRWIAETEGAATAAVVDRETAGEPVAGAAEPAAWLRGVSADMIREASLYENVILEQAGGYSSRSHRNGIMAEETLTELIRILNRMPEDAVGRQKRLSNLNYSYLRSQMSARSGLSVTLHDDVNGLVIILRILDGEDLELIMADAPESAEEDPYLDNGQCWEIENQELLEFLQTFQAEPTFITISMSARTELHQNRQWGLTLSAENVTPGGMTVVCRQNGTLVDGELTTDAGYCLMRVTENGTQVVPTLQEAVFTSEGWVIDSGETYRWDTDWQWLYGELEPGVYWLRKTMYLCNGSDTATWTATVEFTVEESVRIFPPRSIQLSLNEQKLLDICVLAMENLGATENVHLKYSQETEGYPPEVGSDYEYWQSGDTWLLVRRFEMADSADDFTVGNYSSDGVQYRYGHQGTGTARHLWTLSQSDQYINRPWLLTGDFLGENVAMVTNRYNADSIEITLYFDGAPRNAGSDTCCGVVQTWLLDLDWNLIRITESCTMSVILDGVEYYPRITQTIHVSDGDAESIRSVLEEAAAEISEELAQ